MSRTLDAVMWAAFALALASGFDVMVTGVIAHKAAELINQAANALP
jgi:hypothetical protein